MRVAIRDAVNRPSRKPFCWGGLKGYEQLQAVAQALRSVPPEESGTGVSVQGGIHNMLIFATYLTQPVVCGMKTRCYKSEKATF